MPSLPPYKRVRWSSTYRIVPSRFPPIDLFERVGDPKDWDVIAEIEGLTNARIRDEIGDICLVPIEDRISGPGASPVMAAFTHIGHESRFTDGKYGVYYAGNRIEVALKEVAFHLTKFNLATDEPAYRPQYRTYIGKLDTRMHDIRGGWTAEHNPDSWAKSQEFGKKIRELGSNGIVYDSVRHSGGQCIAAFKPLAVGHVVQGPHYVFQWSGEQMTRYFCISDERWKPFN